MQFLNFSDNTASIVQVIIPVSTVQCAARLWTDTMFGDLKPFAHFERERERACGDSLTLCNYVSQKAFKLL